MIYKIGDFSRFDSLDKILAYADFSPSTYQSGQLNGAYAYMENVVPNICDMLCTMPPSMSALYILIFEFLNYLLQNYGFTSFIVWRIYLRINEKPRTFYSFKKRPMRFFSSVFVYSYFCILIFLSYTVLYMFGIHCA